MRMSKKMIPVISGIVSSFLICSSFCLLLFYLISLFANHSILFWSGHVFFFLFLILFLILSFFLVSYFLSDDSLYPTCKGILYGLVFSLVFIMASNYIFSSYLFSKGIFFNPFVIVFSRLSILFASLFTLAGGYFYSRYFHKFKEEDEI